MKDHTEKTSYQTGVNDRAVGMEERAETMGVEGQLNKKKGRVRRKKGTRQVPPIPSENLYRP